MSGLTPRQMPRVTRLRKFETVCVDETIYQVQQSVNPEKSLLQVRAVDEKNQQVTRYDGEKTLPDLSLAAVEESFKMPAQVSVYNDVQRKPYSSPLPVPVEQTHEMPRPYQQDMEPILQNKPAPSLHPIKQLMGKKWLKVAVRVLFTVALFGMLFKSVSWPTLIDALVHIQHGAFLVAMVVGATGIVLSAYQWRSLLHGERIRYDLADLINLYVVGIAFSHFLPTGMGGDAIKAMVVGRRSGNTPGSASAAAMCRVSGFFCMLIVAIPVLLIWHSAFTSTLILSFVGLSLLVGAMIGGAIVSVIFLPRMFKGKLAKLKFLKPAISIGNALCATFKRPRSMVISTLFGIAFWIVAILNCYSYGQALGIHAHLYFYFLVVPLISLVSFLPISINGFGLRESAFVYAFATIHVASSTALLLALLQDAQALIFAIVGGCLYFTVVGGQRMTGKYRAIKIAHSQLPKK